MRTTIHRLLPAFALLVGSGPLFAFAQVPAPSGTLQVPSNRQAVATTAQKMLLPVAPPNPIPISALPFSINTPGYYQVTDDLLGAVGESGITVLVEDVVIDLNGFTLTGVPGSMNGIVAVHRCTVFNGEIRSWGGRGVIVSSDALLSGLQVLFNAQGGVECQLRNVIQGCDISGNVQEGVSGGGLLTLIDCRISFNGAQGVVAGDYCVLLNCHLASNAGFGAEVGSFSRLSGCSALTNHSNGFWVGAHSSISDCSSSGNSGGGFTTGPGCVVERSIAHDNAVGFFVTSSVVVDCKATGNFANGFTGHAGTTFQRCIASGNNNGFSMVSEGGRIEGCNAHDNLGSGITASQATLIQNNVATSNGQRGIDVSVGNRIDGNHVAFNGVGIEASGPRNLIVRNSLDLNDVQTQIAAENIEGPFLKTKGFIQSENPWANFDLSFPASFP